MDPTATPTPTPTPTVDPTTVPVPTGITEVALTGTQWDLIVIALVVVVFVAGFLLVVKL